MEIQKKIENEIDIEKIISNECLISHFQPIFSIKDIRIIGFEALARATDPYSGKAIPPGLLFKVANEKGRLLELDCLCRKKAIEGFSKFANTDDNLLLFLNLDVSILNNQNVGTNEIIELVNQCNINPERVVIEFIESKVSDIEALQSFLSIHRNHGFIIALDDLGTGYSNLERIPLMKPDIIKLDRSLISGINSEYHKQELFDFFIKFAHKIGVLVIAEGIESIDEALTCLELGADLVQGFYFEKPISPENFAFYESIPKIVRTNAIFKDHIKSKFEKQKKQFNEYDYITNIVCSNMENTTPENYDVTLINIVNQIPEIECAYVLHETGIQISSTILNSGRNFRKRSTLFAPTDIGCDKSSEEYYIALSKSQLRYITSPHVSKASGNICVTIASLLTCNDNRTIVICIDISNPVT